MKWRSVKGYCNEIGCSEMRISLLSSLIATITKRITFATQILEIAYYGMRCLWKKQMSRTFSFDPFWLLSNTRLLWPISLSPILLVLHLIAQSSFLLCLIAFPRTQTFDERNYSNIYATYSWFCFVSWFREMRWNLCSLFCEEISDLEGKSEYFCWNPHEQVQINW